MASTVVQDSSTTLSASWLSRPKTPAQKETEITAAKPAGGGTEQGVELPMLTVAVARSWVRVMPASRRMPESAAGLSSFTSAMTGWT